MTLESKPSTTDPPNTAQVSDRNNETEKTEKNMEDYYEAKIDHNHPNFNMIWKKVKKERRDLRARINLFNKYKLPYSSTNYLFIAKVTGAETRKRND